MCGKDQFTGRNYEHRRAWVENRLLLLAGVFSIDVYAYAVMHNHSHLVLYVNLSENQSISDAEVLRRWAQVRKLDATCAKYLVPQMRMELTELELLHVSNKTKMIRERLGSISWFMSLLNQHIARKANKEDECTGRFWEGRFKSQALLTEKAILSCMSYVDLNPIRAGFSSCLKGSSHTSICRRLKFAHALRQAKLVPINLKNKKTKESFLCKISLEDYIEHLQAITLDVDTSKQRVVHIGSIAINQKWIKHSHIFETSFSYAAGSKSAVAQYRKLVRANMTAHNNELLNQ